MVHEAWRLNNPRLAWVYSKRRRELKKSLPKEPDELEGFHGSYEGNLISIVSNGFDSGRRCGQAYGAGEYFAKNPEVSRSYCRGGAYMLVCRLMLGTSSGQDADHIWAAGPQYYVISQPSQVLPLFIIRFKPIEHQVPENLCDALKSGYDTLQLTKQCNVPPNRPCQMTATSTDALWIGYLQPAETDKSLLNSVADFLKANLGIHHGDAQVQIVRGRFTQAKVRLVGSNA